MHAVRQLSTQTLSALLIGIICTSAFFRFFPIESATNSADIQDWIGPNDSTLSPLSSEDMAYLSSLKEIRKCIDPHWLPLEGVRDGQHVGVIAELLSSVEKVLGHPIRLVETKDWVESVEYLQQGKCDIVTSDVEMGESEYLKTIPFINLHHVYVVRSSEPIEIDFNKVKHKTIGIPRGYPTKALLMERYGEINFVEVSTVNEGVELVSKGELFAFADILPVISYSISEQGLTNIKVGGHLDLDLPTVMAVNRDKPQLVDILNKLFLIADRNISSQILSKWVKVEYDVRVDWLKWLKVFLFFGAILLLFVIWNRKLAQVNSKLDQSNRELKRLTEQDALTSLNNRYYLREEVLPEILQSSICNIALIDIDHFKQINDTYGHALGDKCLVIFAQLMKDVFNQSHEHCIRYGGEEFLVLSLQEKEEEFHTKLEQVRGACEALIIGTDEQTPITMTASFGYLSTSNIDNETELEAALSCADELLYKAKNGGRNQICG